jgi:arylsulfatase A-like enzyme
MRTHATAFTLALLGACATPESTPHGAAPVPPPNVLLILSDDHRDDHLSCAGHPVLRTPSLDRLAAEGTRFTNAFVTTPICAASRASVLTGLPEPAHRYTFGMPPLAERMGERSYPVLLRRAGYRTGFVGKLGVKVAPGYTAEAFDTFVPLALGRYWREQPDGSRRHLTDLVGDAALEFLEAGRDGRPFCLSVSFNAGHAVDGDLVDHYPWPPSEDGLYQDAALPRPRLDSASDFEALPPFLRRSMGRARYGWRWDTPEKYDRNLRAYYRLLTGMDRNVGRLLDALDRLGLADRTLVLFMGDNGYAMAERGLAGKWTHFEESLRVPLIARGPGVARGRIEPRMALNIDLAPTVLDACGVTVPVEVEGLPLAPLLRGAGDVAWRDGFRCEHGFDPGSIPRWVGWRTQRWKYARYVDQAPVWEALYDLRADPLERVNLAGSPEHADVLGALRAQALAAGDVLRAPVED